MTANHFRSGDQRMCDIISGQDRTHLVPQEKRINSIDTFRVVAIFAVICLHTLPFQGPIFEGTTWRKFGALVKLCARFAVPSFFVISGYLYGQRLRNGAPPAVTLHRSTKRLLAIFLFWTAAYLVLPVNLRQIEQYGVLRNTYWKCCLLWEQPLAFVLEGGSTHLWFLTALACALWIITPFAAMRNDRGLFAVAVFFFAVHLLAGPYAFTALGFELPIHPRNGPLVSTLFVAIGWYLSANDFAIKPILAVSLGA